MGFEVVAAAGGTLSQGQLTTLLDPVYSRRGADLQQGYVPGGFTTSLHTARALNTQTLGVASYAPLFVDRDTTFDRIGMEVVATAATATQRVGIYANNATSDLPDALVAGTDSLLDTHTATGLILATINVTLKAGRYWLVAVSQTAAAQVRGGAVSGVPLLTPLSAAAATGVGMNSLYQDTNAVLGALPANASPSVAAGAVTVPPLVWLRMV